MTNITLERLFKDKTGLIYKLEHSDGKRQRVVVSATQIGVPFIIVSDCMPPLEICKKNLKRYLADAQISASECEGKRIGLIIGKKYRKYPLCDEWYIPADFYRIV